MKCSSLTAALALVGLFSLQAHAVPPVMKTQLATRWTAGVDPEHPWPEYPRPQLVRGDWTNLNGVWQYAIRPVSESAAPNEWDGEIVVPFCVESALSRVKKAVQPSEAVWYRRSFATPKHADSGRILLHFGAVDWEATVWVSGKLAGSHRGGYDPFTFDVTKLLKAEGDNEVIVRVLDPTDTGKQPLGKQVLKPNSIWYTAVTGIWQTVWLEAVPAVYIVDLDVVPDVDNSSIAVTAHANGGGKVHIVVTDADHAVVAAGDGEGANPVIIKLAQPKLWSPDSPSLYNLSITLTAAEGSKDEVGSYFGLRKIAVGPDAKGVTRLLLNDQPLFQYGPLDQGWWPDGLYTAPCDEALRYDIEVTKRLGFNMARKHVKVEPARWYYWCDKLGLLVWQDMPSGDRHIGGDQPDIVRDKESAAEFETEWLAIIDALDDFPSIVAWVPFNEGWGQFDTARIAKLTKDRDPTRLVNAATGWADRGVGDIRDRHPYPGPEPVAPEPHRAAALGEFGGLGLPLEGHTWIDKGNWGYKSYTTSAELEKAYLELVEKLRPMIADPGMSAAVYTQTTDVEIEVNGLMTYDRKVIKMDADRVSGANRYIWSPAASGGEPRP